MNKKVQNKTSKQLMGLYQKHSVKGLCIHVQIYCFFTGLTWPIGFEDHIRLDAELPQQGYTLGGLQVDGHRPFPSALRVQRHGHIGSVHADHLRSKVGQDHAAERRRCQPRELDHPHPSQRHSGTPDGEEIHTVTGSHTDNEACNINVSSVPIKPLAYCSQWAACSVSHLDALSFLCLGCSHFPRHPELSNKRVLEMHGQN